MGDIVEMDDDVESPRDLRQALYQQWVEATFGPDHANSLPQRGTRFFEEACELYQVCGGDRAMAHRLLDFVFNKPLGEIAKEIGDVGGTLLSVASLAGVSADDQELHAVARCIATDSKDMAARNKAKNDAGFDAGVSKLSLLAAPYGPSRHPAYGPGSITDGATYERCACDKRLKSECNPPEECEQ